ncbi:MAG: hypothetical protein KJI70_00740 [Patescibacteria group bacterium]|nr:hypothetical protein [Patescibacteria group bacterium]
MKLNAGAFVLLEQALNFLATSQATHKLFWQKRNEIEEIAEKSKDINEFVSELAKYLIKKAEELRGKENLRP